MSPRGTAPIEILLIEDNPGDVLLTEEAIAEADIHTTLTVIGDGEKALTYLQGDGPYAGRAEPALIILDLNLPGISGHQVLSLIKREEVWSTIPVLVFSSSRDGSEIRRCYEAQANSYVTKPTKLDDFTTAVRQMHDYWLHTACLPTAQTP